MTLEEIAAYCHLFYRTGDKKITLNFIVMERYPIDPKIIHSLFDPAKVLIKLTPLNPTKYARENGLKTMLDPHNETSIASLTTAFQLLGFETIISIGNLEENEIGSNCGQYISKNFEKKSPAKIQKVITPVPHKPVSSFL